MAPNEKSEQQELVQALPGAQIQLAFAYRDAPGQWRCVRVPILQDAAEQFRNVAERAARQLHDERTEVDYDPEWPLKSTEFFAIANGRPAPPIGGDVFPQLDDFGQLPLYPLPRRRSNPNLYVVLAQLDDGSLAMFGRRITARHLLDSKGWMKFVWTNETFSLLEGPVVAFDRFIDWIEWRQTALVLDAGSFHLSFRDVAELLAAVQTHVDQITQHVSIVNAEAFVERCRSMPSMASKLDSVVQQRHFEKPLDLLKEYAANYPGLHVEWQGDDLVFDDSIEKQFAILKLLDEAGYTGDLSGDKFEAAAKRPI